MENCIIPKLPFDNFDWLRWLYGIDVWREIGVACRYYDILEKRNILIKYAIGYTEAERVICRPKENELAVMFLINDNFCWTHFRKKEFDNVFVTR
jgi:hypothetical protein